MISFKVVSECCYLVLGLLHKRGTFVRVGVSE